MFDLHKILRRHIAAIVPYATARDEFSGSAAIFLDANENPFGSATGDNHHRYPDPLQKKLKARIAELRGVTVEQIFVGNGSDEAIDLLTRAICEPHEDEVVVLDPSYGMYGVSAAVNAVKVVPIALGPDYELRTEAVLSAVTPRTKLIFICSPNNPTGNLLDRTGIMKIIRAFAGLVVVDEAYIDFAPPGSSLLTELSACPNLVVLQTLSKAWGMAEIRVGMAFACAEIVAALTKIKAPYNVNGVSQALAFRALQTPERMTRAVGEICRERDRLSAALTELPCVSRVHRSDANYLLVQMHDASKIFEHLLKCGIVVRDRSRVKFCEEKLRISIGTAAENDELLRALGSAAPIRATLKSSLNSTNSTGDLYETAVGPTARTAIIQRRTKETEITVRIDLDGLGRAEIRTGLGFFDHMLEQIARHSSIDLEIAVRGDLHVDEHHTIEDTAIALGEALDRALGDKRGIERYGFMLPMDDALAQVALDLSGRSWLVWQADFRREKIGDMPTEMFKHFFKSLSDAARCNLNIRVDGENEHHKVEAIFKGFARALRMAIRRDGSTQLPSTKGVL